MMSLSRVSCIVSSIHSVASYLLHTLYRKHLFVERQRVTLIYFKTLHIVYNVNVFLLGVLKVSNIFALNFLYIVNNFVMKIVFRCWSPL